MNRTTFDGILSLIQINMGCISDTRSADFNRPLGRMAWMRLKATECCPTRLRRLLEAILDDENRFQIVVVLVGDVRDESSLRNHNKDGRHIGYLHQLAKWRHFDPQLLMLSLRSCRRANRMFEHWKPPIFYPAPSSPVK